MMARYKMVKVASTAAPTLHSFEVEVSGDGDDAEFQQARFADWGVRQGLDVLEDEHVEKLQRRTLANSRLMIVNYVGAAVVMVYFSSENNAAAFQGIFGF
jgi:hypothetical protein